MMIYFLHYFKCFSEAIKDNQADFVYSSFNIVNKNNEIIKKNIL